VDIMKNPILGALSLALLMAAAPVYALTVDEVIGLSRAGASDSLILSKIDADRTVFHLTVAEILDLKEKQVSDVVITYMVNTGKTEVLENTNPGTAPDSTAVTPNDQNQKYSGTDDGGQVGMGVGVDSYGGVGLSFGYYYPHWPGYYYSYYYDPFWWPSWSFYAGFWQPYPYYYWYYDPWYNGGYYHGYYDHCYYGGHYHYGYNDGYGDSYADGRNVGNRGSGTGYDRVIKNPSGPGAPGSGASAGNRALKQSRESFRMRDPGSDLAAVQSVPNVIRGQVRRPVANHAVTRVQRSRYSTQPSPQYMRSVPRGSQVTRNTTRSQPAPQEVTVVRSRPSDGGQRVARAAPQGGRSAPPSFSGGRSFGGGGSSGGIRGGGGFHGGGGGGGGRTGKH
jgi:hypothetical protein